MIIKLKDIRANVLLGVYDIEREAKQRILINLTIDYDEGNAPITDKIEDTLDYCELTKEIVEKIEETNFTLLEKLVTFVADIVMKDERANNVIVEIDKPDILTEYARSVSVTLSSGGNKV